MATQSTSSFMVLVKNLVRNHTFAWSILLIILILRGVMLNSPALLDPTESRYAVVAQRMFTSHDWLTPKITMNGESISYLGKPPLHFWLAASAFSAFGMEAWAGRLPSFLALLIIIWSTFAFSSRVLNLKFPLGAGLIVCSSGLVFVLSGAVAVDLTLAATVALALTCFAIGAVDSSIDKPSSNQFRWGMGFFASCALAFMTKGPIGLVLIGLPIAGMISVERNFSDLRRLPWIFGIILFGLITAPWFILCEIKNPGFLTYFFINENFLRFVSRSYGDRYGSGHVHPYGSIWWMWAVGFLPWALLLPWLVKRHGFKSLFRVSSTNSKWLVFATLWAIAPAMFFTAARQIHIGYVAPAMPGLAILTSALLEQHVPVMNPRVIRLMQAILFACILLAWIVGGFLKFNLSFIGIAAIAIPGAIVLFLMPSSDLAQDERAFVSIASALVAFLLLSILAVGADYIGKQLSTEFMLKCAVRTNSKPNPRIGILGDTAFSAEFNSENWKAGLGRPIALEYFDDSKVTAILEGEFPEDILVRTRKMAELPENLRTNFTAALSEGRWTWLRHNKIPVDVSLCR